MRDDFLIIKERRYLGVTERRWQDIGKIVALGVVLFAVGFVAFQLGARKVVSLTETVWQKIAAPAQTGARPMPSAYGPVRPMPFCIGSVRTDCVVDGDTIWVGGEKIRLSGVDAPEIAGTCGYERDLAQRAKSRLSELLSKTPFLISRSGIDRYGRTLAAINLERGGTAGSVLVREGLARAWVGRRIPWC